jgi:alkylation response protein AidB-like acyl-CoA dehydrogenase
MSSGIDKEQLDAVLGSLREFAHHELTDEKLRQWDKEDIIPIDVVRQMCDQNALGIQMLFVASEFGGMGGSTFDVYRTCEAMARIDLGLATAVLATFLGSDPIVVGGTPEQKMRWLSRIANDGALVAYGATEPSAGSDLGAMKSTATRVEENGQVVGYKLNGSKQWISNGGVADFTTILAMAPGGPTWFVVEKDTPGFAAGKPEEKHGIRLSNTSALTLDDVYVEKERLIGGVEGQGLIQAQAVFGYTRVMVASFGLGVGWAALDRAIPYSVERIQGGGPLSEKQGYTHKLIIPWITRLEAGRAYIEHAAELIDAAQGLHGQYNTEGAIAKYLSTEAGNSACEAAIQALGGYGYTHEYMVEKYKRDVRITTIYEGTSEIMEMTISRDRWQLHMKTRGQHYVEMGKKLDRLHVESPKVGANIVALAFRALAEILERVRVHRLTRNQHVLFRLGELIAHAEGAWALSQRASNAEAGRLNEKADQRFKPETLARIARVYAREAALKVGTDGLRWVAGSGGVQPGEMAAFEKAMGLQAIFEAQAGALEDMDRIADAVYSRVPST